MELWACFRGPAFLATLLSTGCTASDLEVVAPMDSGSETSASATTGTEHATNGSEPNNAPDDPTPSDTQSDSMPSQFSDGINSGQPTDDSSAEPPVGSSTPNGTSGDNSPGLPSEDPGPEAEPPAESSQLSQDDACILLPFYRDADGDGQGLDAAVQMACQAPAGYVPMAGDCNDTCDTCLRGGVEVCDGADNNCDGQTDEGCTCVEGATQECGSDTGECKAGLMTCGADGQWGTDCAGQVAAQSEVCNGLDDDCDGDVDEPDPGVCPGEYCVEGSCVPCTKATQARDCGTSTACLKRECVANACQSTPQAQCTGPTGQPGTCDALGTCRYCGDGVWSQDVEECDESVARWKGSCQACVPTFFSPCDAYKNQTTCPTDQTCFFTVCARTCNSVLDCPPEPSITCQEFFEGQKLCVWTCRNPDDSKCPDSQMICDVSNVCMFPATP